MLLNNFRIISYFEAKCFIKCKTCTLTENNKMQVDIFLTILLDYLISRS